jgi:nitroreductase
MSKGWIMSENECIRMLMTRQSIRRFTDKDIDDEVINGIIETALRAPSAGNRQPWRIVVVRDHNRIQRLAAAAGGQSVVSTCKVLFGIFAVPDESAERYGERGRNLYCIQDTAALTYALLLAIHINGLGACWVGAFDDDAVADGFNAPSEYKPVAMIPIGAYGESPPLRSRRSPSEVVIREHF